MAEQQSENRPRQQGGGNRRNNNHRRRPGGDDRSRNDRDTYGRSGGSSEYTPPREQQRKTFGGGEYERVYRDKPVPKKPLGQRILGFLSFGFLGKDKPAAKTTGPARGRSDAAGRGDSDSDRGAGQSRRGGDRRERPDRFREARPAARRSENGDNPERRQPPREPREPRERTPQALDLDAIVIPRLHIGNLSYDTVESDLFGLCNGVGKVLNAEIVTHSRTQRSKGFGFVQFATVEEAKRAATELHGKPFMGRSIIVGPAKGPRPERASHSEEDAEDEIRPAPLNMD